MIVKRSKNIIDLIIHISYRKVKTFLNPCIYQVEFHNFCSFPINVLLIHKNDSFELEK